VPTWPKAEEAAKGIVIGLAKCFLGRFPYFTPARKTCHHEHLDFIFPKISIFLVPEYSRIPVRVCKDYAY
jgi:hypothetical protein